MLFGATNIESIKRNFTNGVVNDARRNNSFNPAYANNNFKADVSLSFVVGIITGALVVPSSVVRTIAVHEGKVKSAFTSSILNSISYGASIYFIAKGDWLAYFGSMVGSTALCVIMAAKNKNKKVNNETM